MNMIDCTVVRVTSEPYEAYGRWWVDVIANSWGTVQPTYVMCDTLDAAKAIKPGFTFLA